MFLCTICVQSLVVPSFALLSQMRDQFNGECTVRVIFALKIPQL